MKKTFYFSHDYHARNDGKMVKLLMHEGVAGLGMYWCIVEMLYEAGGRLLYSECERIAFELRVDSARITNLILSYDLFESDGQFFWSNSIIERLEQRQLKSENASKSAKYRWNNANALRDECDGNAIKESKVKENKIKDNKINNNSIILLDETISKKIETHVLSDFLKNCPNVSRLKKQLTPDQAEKLLVEFSRPEVESVLESMENYKDLQKKYASVYLTAKRWLALGRERQNQKTNGTATKPSYTDSLKNWFNGAGSHSV